jgi:hypothetical protein
MARYAEQKLEPERVLGKSELFCVVRVVDTIESNGKTVIYTQEGCFEFAPRTRSLRLGYGRAGLTSFVVADEKIDQRRELPSFQKWPGAVSERALPVPAAELERAAADAARERFELPQSAPVTP